MTVGDGIFCGVVVASFVALFLGTKDRWRWKRIALWTSGGLFGTAVVVVAGVYGYAKWEERPQVITEYWGIKLGSPQSDVVFLKGQPAERSENNWFYKTDKVGMTVEFKDKKVVAVLAMGDRTYMPDVGTISTYLTIEQLMSRLGQPDVVVTSDDGEDRVLNYMKYNFVAAYNRNGMFLTGMSATGKPVEFKVQWEDVAPAPANGELKRK